MPQTLPPVSSTGPVPTVDAAYSGDTAIVPQTAAICHAPRPQQGHGGMHPVGAPAMAGAMPPAIGGPTMGGQGIGASPGMAPPAPMGAPPPAAVQPRAPMHIVRSRAYSFIRDENGNPIELGSGRSGKAFLGEELWLESKTSFRRRVAIKILQKGVTPEDGLRFQMEKEVLERVQGHSNIVTLFASGESDNQEFVPPSIRDKVENDFMVLELCDMSLEERLKGSRGGEREELLAYSPRDRLFRVLEYLMPIASAVEYAHLACNVCHRDIKPGNILLRLPNPQLQGSTLDVRLADFNVGKIRDDAQDLSVTRLHGVPGTLFFQAPEQETNAFEILVNVQQGSKEVTYFEDFYIAIAQNDTFELFNRGKRYPVASADLAKRRLYLARAFEDGTENNVRAKIIKSVDRPADIYSLGALFYYLITGTHGNPKTLYDAFYKFIEYDGPTDGEAANQNTVEAYIEHEYSVIQSLRAPKVDEHNQPVLAPADRFFSYKHYLDGNGELIDKIIIKVIAKAMIRNKADSYCQASDVTTTGISAFVNDLRALYGGFGTYMPTRPGTLVLSPTSSSAGKRESSLAKLWQQLMSRLRSRRATAPRTKPQPPRTPPTPPRR
ncbi:MAG: protein kinase [Deltaproteobacteria bacterium]|nr:protein kinase [Deltaproteobacteria bacterium]